MAKVFNVSAVCIPQAHYMVNIDQRLAEIKKLVDDGKYFTINCARQYGKTTTLRALREYLQEDYYAILLDFQKIGTAKYKNENTFSLLSPLFGRLFSQVGKSIVYNADEPEIDIATMFGFIKNSNGAAVIANRIFETRLYNFYLQDQAGLPRPFLHTQ